MLISYNHALIWAHLYYCHSGTADRRSLFFSFGVDHGIYSLAFVDGRQKPIAFDERLHKPSDDVGIVVPAGQIPAALLYAGLAFGE